MLKFVHDTSYPKNSFFVLYLKIINTFFDK